MFDADDATRVLEKADCLYNNDEVEQAIDRLGKEISQSLAGLDPIIVCVMNGGLVPFGKLLPKLYFPCRVDYVHATRYGESLKGGELEWISKPQLDAANQEILLIDDILDEGITLAGIERYYKNQGAKNIHTAVLVVKDRTRPVDIYVDYIGLSVPDRYVFGYGMDYKGYLRNAPGIYAEASS